MGHLEAGPRAGGPGRGERLVEGVEQTVQFVPDMARVEAAGLGGDLGQPSQLACRSMDPGRIDEPGAEPDRPGVEGLPKVPDHRPGLDARGRPGSGADNGAPDRPVSHEEGVIGSEGLAVDRVEVLAERPPVGHLAGPGHGQLDGLATPLRDRRERVPQFPESWVV